MSALIALLNAPAQGGGPAFANIFRRFPLLARQDRVPASQKIALMGAEDIPGPADAVSSPEIELQ